MATVDSADATIAKASPSDAIVVGLVNKWTPKLADMRPPSNGILSFLSTTNVFTQINGDLTYTTSMVRAPVLDKKGTPKVLNLYMAQVGLSTDPLKWKTYTAQPMPESALEESAVVRLQVFELKCGPGQWRKISPNVIAAANAWLKQLAIPDEDIIEVFLPKRLIGVKGVSCNVRIKPNAAKKIDAASGVNAWLARELPTDANSAPPPPGSVQWIDQLDDETEPAHLIRCRKLAEAEATCRGLAFSSTGSLGLRRDAGPCASAFYADPRRYHRA
jgi:hypothetical protein